MICRRCECKTKSWANGLCEDCDTSPRRAPEATVAIVGTKSRIDAYRRRFREKRRLFAANDSNLIEINLE